MGEVVSFRLVRWITVSKIGEHGLSMRDLGGFFERGNKFSCAALLVMTVVVQQL